MSYPNIYKDIAVRGADIVGVIGDRVPLWEVCGSLLMGCCPFHHDDDGCLWVRPDDRTWGCHACRHPGDVVDFVSAYERVEAVDAVGILADRYKTIVSMN